MDPIERYLSELHDLHLSGAAVAETSGYPVLRTLLDEIGKALKPKVRCIIHLKSQGAGIPDGGLFTLDQFPKRDAQPRAGQLPNVGAVEVKPVIAELAQTIAGEQVLKYVLRYGQVLVTNYREFVLMVRTRGGNAKRADSFSLAPTPEAFWRLAAQPRNAAAERGSRLVEFLTRVLRNRAVLTEPEDVAWFLASHARDAMDAVGHHSLPTLEAVRAAFEEALGIRFEGEKGDHFFRSSLVQTLFYGIFSGWVLWSREHPPTDETPFDWQKASWHLKVPMINALFAQIAQPAPIEELGLKAILDRTGEVLNRVDRAGFFSRFQDAEAVQYFYEPFLEAFDPELRKELGVWYTPREVVKYMVARVHTVLKEELGIARGLADPSVYVLDPCCGTGAYLVEVLETIAGTLRDEGGDALVASDLRKAARERVYGFELLPAPFVVSHLQLGLLLQRLGAPLGAQKGDRAGVFLTNALTGWTAETEQHPIPFPGMEEERDRSDEVKRAKPILVILGNPPYNGFAGMAVEEERDLSHAYRTTIRAPKPQGQGLNDLYVRFFRMAERKIVEQTGRGVICFISNYSWLDGLSFTGMRERYLEKFDRIWIDCLNGDKYKTGKLTPEGDPDPSIFSTRTNREGIQVGTAVSLLVRKQDSRGAGRIAFRHLWGKLKRARLATESEGGAKLEWADVTPVPKLGLPFAPTLVGVEYTAWPTLPELMPVSFPGVQSKRDDLVVDIDRPRLEQRIKSYFDPNISDAEMERICPAALHTTNKAFDLRRTRRRLIERGYLPSFIVRYCYKPFDVRWIYWEPEEDLLGRKSPELFRNTFRGNTLLEARQRQPTSFDRGYTSTALPDNFGNGFSSFFPHLVAEGGETGELHDKIVHANLSTDARRFADGINADKLEVFYHVVSLMHSLRYRDENSGALRQDWPRIPLPARNADLEASATLGRQLADLLDPETPVPGVSTGVIRPELRPLGELRSTDKKPIDPEQGDLASLRDGAMPERAASPCRVGARPSRGPMADSMCTSTTGSTGPVFPAPSGSTPWAATRSSRSG
jgi:hypothetical protein